MNIEYHRTIEQLPSEFGFILPRYDERVPRINGYDNKLPAEFILPGVDGVERYQRKSIIAEIKMPFQNKTYIV